MIARRKPLPRSSKPIARKTRVKPVNRKRRDREWTRAYGSKARVAFVRSLPCIVGNAGCRGVIENAHVGTGGTGRKADASAVVPLCTRHHHNLHQFGAEGFQLAYAMNLKAQAALTETRWQIANGSTVVEQLVAKDSTMRVTK